MSLMLLVIIVLIGWIIINRASENGWSIGDFLHNSDTMVSDGEQSGTFCPTFLLHVVQQGKEPAGTFVLLVDNAFHLFRSLKVSVLSSLSHSLLLASDADVGYQPLHVFGLVIELALEAGERQPSGIAESLQGTRRDVKAQADILAVQSLSGFLTAVSLIQSVHMCGQVLGACQHPLKIGRAHV